MGRLIREKDWSSSPIGLPDSWPAELRSTMSLILPASSEIVVFWGDDMVALYNDAYAPTIGDKHPAALGRPAREAWAELWDDLEPLLRHVVTTGETYAAKDRPFYIERHDGLGEEVYFDISYSAIRLDDGSVGGVLCIVSETTDRVLASRAIAEDRARLSQMFDEAPSFMTLLRGPALVYEVANSAYLELIGKPREAVVGKPLAEVLPEVVAQGFADLLTLVRETGRSHRALAAPVDLARGESGALERRYVDFVFQPLTDAAGTVTGVFVEGSDVTDRMAAEERLRVSEESLRLATDAAGIGTWDLDLVNDVLTWSDRCKAMFGISPRVPVSLVDFYAGLHPDDIDSTRAAFDRALDPETRAPYDVAYRTIGAEDGIVRWIAARGIGLFDEGRCVRALGTVIDITQHRVLDDELRESEARFRTLADTAPALIWMTDRDGATIFLNSWFRTLLGFDPASLVGPEGWLAVIHPADRAIALKNRRARIANYEAFGGDIRLVDTDGNTRWVHAEGQPRFAAGEFIGYVGCAVDVTEAHQAAEALEARIDARTAELAAANDALVTQIAERERVEATLQQMQRLEAIGQLTAGVAHDFNNLLTVVLGNVAMVERQPDGTAIDAKIRQRLGHVRTAAERGASLTAQLLAFARRTPLASEAVDLNDVVQRMQSLLQSSLGGSITIATDLAPGLWPALVDPTQVELIILNLAINARDAMPVGGALTVATTNVTLDAPRSAEEPPAGDYVAVAVRDTGTGMTPDVRARVFEPFFTTKEVGKGSGLGLAQVFGFAKQSGGGVRIDTVFGAGTTVTVFLPRTDAAHMATIRDDAEEPGARHGAGRVLLLDDDDAVRAVAADDLRQAGFAVVEASSGAAALGLIDEHRDISAAIVDFAMPGMNGAEFARRARERRALPVLFVTGYADRDAIDALDDVAVVLKPYRSGDVARALRRLIDKVPMPSAR
ncbi:hybrid sensor histidine kinase/response regulator [Sphingomonas sp. EC-HK361]|uniref:hybrid sensor histidine kinase/response regulator n=1 Tax=Sphingomonas sp. EC-HK361 TaxID=2038397 RepID=UPI001F331C11|nr:PAS domain S-box protein [Sphingomonas sp. EC-HK361]